jgi:hypothetical protein
MTNKPLAPSKLLAAIAAGACFTNAASAQVCFHGMHGSHDLGPDASVGLEDLDQAARWLDSAFANDVSSYR